MRARKGRFRSFGFDLGLRVSAFAHIHVIGNWHFIGIWDLVIGISPTAWGFGIQVSCEEQPLKLSLNYRIVEPMKTCDHAGCDHAGSLQTCALNKLGVGCQGKVVSVAGGEDVRR